MGLFKLTDLIFKFYDQLLQWRFEYGPVRYSYCRIIPVIECYVFMSWSEFCTGVQTFLCVFTHMNEKVWNLQWVVKYNNVSYAFWSEWETSHCIGGEWIQSRGTILLSPLFLQIVLVDWFSISPTKLAGLPFLTKKLNLQCCILIQTVKVHVIWHILRVNMTSITFQLCRGPVDMNVRHEC